MHGCRIPSKHYLPPEKQYTCHTYAFTLLAIMRLAAGRAGLARVPSSLKPFMRSLQASASAHCASLVLNYLVDPMCCQRLTGAAGWGAAQDFSTLGCLRDHKDELAAACQAEVFKRQQEAADDWRTDTELATACKVNQSAIFYTPRQHLWPDARPACLPKGSPVDCSQVSPFQTWIAVQSWAAASGSQHATAEAVPPGASQTVRARFAVGGERQRALKCVHFCKVR